MVDTIDQSVRLGPCCACEQTAGVRHITCLQLKGTVPGHGWGCPICDLPLDGALAVVCDNCVTKPLRFACRGYPAFDGRIAISELREPYGHDESKHPEFTPTL